MTPDLKADLLDALSIADRPDHVLTTKEKNTLRARLQAATVTEPPPPPDPCLVECGLVRTKRSDVGACLLTVADGPREVHLLRYEAAALIPALQAFVAEGGQ